MLRAATLMSLAAVSGAAVAQPAITIEVDDPVLLPGESTTVRLSAAFDPDDYAMAGLATDVVSTGGSWSDLMLVSPMDGPGTSPGAASGTRVDGILAGQLHFPVGAGIFADDSNPIAFWQATYTVDLATDPTIVDIRTETMRFDVYIWRDSSRSESPLGELVEGSGTITVIPAPASVAVLALSAACLRRRR